MNTEVINQEKMEALKALAETNTKIGEARGILSKLKAEESEYLSEREKKTLEMVQKVLDESEETLGKAFSNYEEIKKFASDASDFSKFLIEAYNDFQELQKTFEEYTKQWNLKVEATETKLSELKKKIQIDQVQLKEDQEAVGRAWKNIAEEKRKIRSDRATLDAAITRLKEGRI